MNTHEPQRHPDYERKRLRQEAINWKIRLTSGEATSADHQQFEQWQTKSLAHEDAWHQVNTFWKDVEQLSEPHIPGQTRLPMETGQESHRVGTSSRILEDNSFKRWGPAVAATIAIVSVIVVSLVNFPRWTADFSTDVAEYRTVTLPDGSRIKLNSYTALNTNYTEQSREIELLMGEALFVVKPNPERAFLVRSGQGLTKAVGTQFTVKRDGSTTQVSVLEGIVEVQHSMLTKSSTLQKEMVVSYNQTQGLHSSPAANMEVITAWLQGHLIFDHTPLSEAITQINQHRTGKIVLLNDELADHRLNGIFRLEALDDVILAIEETTPANIMRVTPYLLLLH